MDLIIRLVIAKNEDPDSPLYGKIDPDKIAIAGHSRGGEMVATAYLFNDLDYYPENGNVTFDYHFNISTLIAIAPTVDQYMPQGHAVEISDVNYLLIHGSNDQDVSSMMGEKQYDNINFSGTTDKTYYKTSVYVVGANNGQFNSQWGRYDLTKGMNGFLHTSNLIKDDDQKLIAKAYIRTFLDMTLKNDTTYMTLMSDNHAYRGFLPDTQYITNYMDSNYKKLFGFEDSINLVSGNMKNANIICHGMQRWTASKDVYGSGTESENYVLECEWNEGDNPRIEMLIPTSDLVSNPISFRIADLREDIDKESELVYSVEVVDVNGLSAKVVTPKIVLPSLKVQLYKQQVLFGNYEYRHQLQTVEVDATDFENDNNVNFEKISKIIIYLDDSSDGKVKIDDVCVVK